MEESLIKRIMPNSLEAEQSVIGSMIMDKDAIVTAMEMLISEDFYHQQYGVLFDAMIELYNKSLPVDLVTLQNKLKEKDVPAEIASLDFVRDLITAVPTSANIKYYAKIVKDNFFSVIFYQLHGGLSVGKILFYLISNCVVWHVS